jgi:hypothetical protein
MNIILLFGILFISNVNSFEISKLSIKKSKINKFLVQKSIGLVGCFSCLFYNGVFPLSSSPVLAETQSLPALKYKTFDQFVSDLRNGLIIKVKFVGINPEYCTTQYKDGEEYIIKDGFPSFDDPNSPSGPAQAIALVQHTPGVECEQDISDLINLLKRDGNSYRPRKMLSHSSYPSEFSR